MELIERMMQERGLAGFLAGLDWTRPCVDLIDEMTDWFIEHRIGWS